MSDSVPMNAKPWYVRIQHALGQHMMLKAIGTPAFIAVFFAAYFYLLKYPTGPVTVMPMLWLDHAIAFEPRAMVLYVSLWVYVSLPPALLETQRALFYYALAIGATCLIGLLVFYVYPTAVPAAAIDWARYPNVHFLKNLDAAGNAFPSLHVATAVFSGIWLNALLRDLRAPFGWAVLNALWCVGIVYSTVATRQHVVVDVLGGLVLGSVAAYLSLSRWHYSRSPAQARTAQTS